jgi:hypothetical protein
MARALQCPDCGHREPLDNVAATDQFRCHGCGRALKVPQEFRTNEADSRVEPIHEPAPEVNPAPDVDAPESTRVLARVSGDEELPPSTSGLRPLTRIEREALVAQAYAPPLPLVARLAAWVLWLPIGLGFTFWFAIKVEWLNKDHLVDTLGKVTWDRFVPIARLLPPAALIVALLVHVTILLLERWAGHRRLDRLRAEPVTDVAD